MSSPDQHSPSARRRLLPKSALALAASPLPVAAADDGVLRIGLTPVFLDDQVSFLARWRVWLERRLQRPVAFVQRGSYREVTDLIRGGKLDFAWICGYPYVRYLHELRLVAVPVWRGRPLYQSYLIVPADDEKTNGLADLRGKVFAYSDPDSNSGFLYPQYRITVMGEKPATYFSRSFFTWAHRKIVEAVGSNLAQGGAVDSYVWETLQIYHPELTARTRIVDKSPYFGHTPVVAREGVSRTEFDSMQEALLGMSQSAAGQDLLKRLNLDGFVTGEDSLFDGIARMMRALNGRS